MNKYLKETFFFDYSNPEIKAFADKIVPENDLDKRWVKATPVFDARLCEKIAVEALEFDGRNNALFQQYNLAGKRAME
ncbi:MAG: hypothetical protein GY781_08210 [Gammaproteobacteria bacterium]|nr:hypothetical protein [Gammaproteobacteria bacterium]